MVATTRYIYDGNQYLAEADENGTINRLYTNEPDAYTRLISQEKVSTSDSLYYQYDVIGSTREVTDEAETVTDEFTYDAWGNRLFRTGMNDIPFQYAGEVGYYKNEESKSYYVMARTYDPSITRWMSFDPIGFEGGDGNLFRYVRNSPVMFTDPSGLWELRCRPIAFGQVHCWVECDGHSYSLLNNNGIATPTEDSPRDLGQGQVVDRGPDSCGCIAAQFGFNTDTYTYNVFQCNSNYYASALMECCGLFVERPRNAFGWGNCNRPEGEFDCTC